MCHSGFQACQRDTKETHGCVLEWCARTGKFVSVRRCVSGVCFGACFAPLSSNRKTPQVERQKWGVCFGVCFLKVELPSLTYFKVEHAKKIQTQIWIKLCWCQLWEPTERSSSPRENWKNRAKTQQRDPTTKGKCCIWNVLLDKHAIPQVCDRGRVSHANYFYIAACYKRSFPTSSCLKSLGVEPQWHFSDIRGISAQRHMSGAGMMGCWRQTMQNAAVCFDRGFQNRCCNLCSRGSCFKCGCPWACCCTWQAREDVVSKVLREHAVWVLRLSFRTWLSCDLGMGQYSKARGTLAQARFKPLSSFVKRFSWRTVVRVLSVGFCQFW